MSNQTSELSKSHQDSVDDKRHLPRRSSVGRFILVSTAIALSFFFRHIAGMIVTHGAYNPLVYNPVEIRVIPPPHYDFLPDDVAWDEVRAYARTTQGFMRNEWAGPVFSSYAPYIDGTSLKSTPFYRDGLGQLVLSWMARIPGSSVRMAFCAADFFFVFAMAFTFLYFCWGLRPSSVFSVAATTAVTLYNWQDMQNLADFLRGGIQNSSFILRTPYPQFSLPLTLLFLIFLKQLTEKPSCKMAGLLTLSITLNFYAYFYSWTIVCLILFATQGFLIISFVSYWNLFQSSREVRSRAFLLITCAAIASFLMTIPVWSGVVRNSPDVIDSFRRINGEFTHEPNIKYTVVLSILLLGSIFAIHKRLQVKWIFPVLLVAGLGVLNLQVLTGKTIQPNHWTSYYIQPFVFIGLIEFAWPMVENLQHRRVVMAVSLLLLVGLTMNFVKFWVAAVETRSYNQKDMAFEELIDELKSPQLTRYGFVTNDYYLTTVLPAYTSLKPLAPLYLDAISDTELWQLRMAAVRETGFADWQSYSQATGQGGTPLMGLPEIRYRFDRVLLVMNKHREIPADARRGRCELFSNNDFLVLKPCQSNREQFGSSE